MCVCVWRGLIDELVVGEATPYKIQMHAESFSIQVTEIYANIAAVMLIFLQYHSPHIQHNMNKYIG